MPQRIGVDIIEISRIQKVCARWGTTFLERVFTPREISLYRNKYASLAARFAAKEATFKALNAKGISWQDIEVTAVAGGRPRVKLTGKAHAAAKKRHITSLDISLSHAGDYAIAFVVGS